MDTHEGVLEVYMGVSVCACLCVNGHYETVCPE